MTLEDKVKVTVLASGFDVTIREDEDKEKKIIVINDEPEDNAGGSKAETDKETKIADVYGHDKMRMQKIDAMKMKYAVLKPSQYDDHEVIALIERTPAYNRPTGFNSMLEHLKDASQTPDGTLNLETGNRNNPAGGAAITF